MKPGKCCCSYHRGEQVQGKPGAPAPRGAGLRLERRVARGPLTPQAERQHVQKLTRTQLVGRGPFGQLVTLWGGLLGLEKFTKSGQVGLALGPDV
jgi:hypothetical protein